MGEVDIKIPILGVEHLPHAQPCPGGFFVYQFKLPDVSQIHPLFRIPGAFVLIHITIVTKIKNPNLQFLLIALLYVLRFL